MLLLALLPGASAQTFITVKPPPPRPSEPGPVTPAFVASPAPTRAPVVPAHAVNKQGSTTRFDVIPVAAQQPGLGAMTGREDDKEMLIRTDMPGPQRLFVRESENQFWDRYKNELAKEGRSLYIPEKSVVSKEPYRLRQFESLAKEVEPVYVCHRRLLFEQPNFERTGWNLGMLQPAVNLGVFWYDAAMLPYHLCMDPQNRMECSAGKCLPGDPAPLYLYRERFSTAGLVGQLGVVTGLIFLFP